MSNDPGFSSDKILEEYARLNSIDWGRDSSPSYDERIEDENIPDENNWENDDHLEGLFENE